MNKENIIKLVIVIGIIIISIILILVFKNALSLMLLPFISFFTRKGDDKLKKDFKEKTDKRKVEIQASKDRHGRKYELNRQKMFS